MEKILKSISFYFAPFCVLKAAMDAGITDFLLDSFIPFDELSLRAKLDAEGVKRVLEVLYQMGLLDRKENSFKLKEELKKFFEVQSPFYIGHYLEHLKNLNNRWENLAQALKGKRKPLKKTKDMALLAKALFPINWGSALELENKLNFRVKRALDVGCGSCVWSIPFALKGARVFALDLPEVIENAAFPIVKSFALSGNYSFIKGDLFQVEWGKGYELIIWGNICHIFPAEKIELMMQKAFKALNSKGKLVIVDFVKDSKALFPYLFDINMYLATRKGKTYSPAEIQHLAKKAGLEFRNAIPLDEERNHSALVLEKP